MQSPSVPLLVPSASVVHAPAQVAQWDPHGTSSFVVSVDSTLKLYRWSPKSNRIELVAAQSDLSSIKCLDWSSHPLYPDLMAVGHTTGKVELIRMGDSSIPAMQSEASPSKIALTNMGTQHSRACISMSFSPLAPAYLAAGFDKSRGQYSLHVWDVERAAKTLAGPAPRANDPSVRSYKPQGPLQPDDIMDFPVPTGSRLAPPRGVANSAASAATSDGSGTIRRYALSEAVTSVAYMPDHVHVLAVGTGLRSLRLYDIRKPRENRESASDIETQAIYGICFDPFDSTRMASYGDNGIVEFWDTRMPKIVLSLDAIAVHDDDDALGRRGLSHIAFSPLRRGLFGTLTQDSQYVRFWSLMGPTAQLEEDNAGTGSDPATPSLTVDENAEDYMNAKTNAESSSSVPLVAGNVRIGRKLPRDVSSFAFIPSIDGTNGHDFVLTTSKDRGVDIWRSPIMPIHSWSTRGELGIASGASFRLTPDKSLPSTVSNIDPWSLDIERPSPPSDPTGALSPSTELAEFRASTPDTNPDEDEDAPRIGRIPFPVLDKVSTRQSSLSVTRKLFASKQGDTPTPSRPPSRNTARPRQHVPSNPRPSRPPDSHQPPLVATGSIRYTNTKPLAELAKVMRLDISEVMRARVLRGYGADSMTHNARVASTVPTPGVDALPRLWLWLEASNSAPEIRSSVVHGFDFSYQGMLSIWEGFSPMSASRSDDPGFAVESSAVAPPLSMTRTASGRGSGSRQRRPSRTKSTAVDPARMLYEQAVEEMVMKRTHGVKKALPKAAVLSHRPTRRQFALGLCDWDLTDAEFDEQIQLWEEDRFTERAACWAVFLQKIPLAIEILLRSRDESLVMLSGTIQLLLEDSKSQGTDTPRQSPWRDHVQRLMVRLGGAYTRAMLSLLVGESWMDILVSETTIPLRERLAIALLFLPDDELSKYFRSLTEDMNRGGDIEALLITGLNYAGLDVIQAYVDNTGDLQTAASLVSFVTPSRWRSGSRPKDARPDRWIESYRILLDGWQFFHHRCQFDLLRGEINAAAIRDGDVAPFEWVPRQMEIRCNYCNKLVNSQLPMDPAVVVAGGSSTTATERVRAEYCPHCRRKLPRCAICLFTVGLVNEDDRELGLEGAVSVIDTSDEAMVFCQACRHGGHSAHILDWFFGGAEGKAHSECAVADCDCKCTEYF